MKPFYNLGFLIALFFAFNTTAQKVAIRSADTGNYISIISWERPDNGGWMISPWDIYYNNYLKKPKPDTLFLGIDKGVCRANYEYLLFYTQKPGFKSKTQLVKRSDIIKSRTTYSLQALQPLPSKTDSDQYISIKKVSFHINGNEYVKMEYETVEDYYKGKVQYKKNQKEELKYENTIFYDSLNKFLAQNGFVDTTGKISFGNSDVVKLDLEVNKLTEHLFGSFRVIELNTRVKIIDAWGNLSGFEKVYQTKSNIAIVNPYAETEEAEVGNALENLLCEIIVDKELREKFVNLQSRMEKIRENWDVIQITNKDTQHVNIESAAMAVVTIKVKQGHGSGCIVSNDGYIITNWHVIEDSDSNNIEAIFDEGTKIKCKIVRLSPFYDLALLKMDTSINTVMKINSDKNIKLGSDVYAIGTPSDIGLGQSISKGIISGKRNIENKLYIQSDVSVNPGNSGGAMTNKNGELIGIVSAKLIGLGIEGVGFAIPASCLEEALKIKIQ